MKFVLVICTLLVTFFSMAQDKMAYTIYNAEGKKSSYKKVLKEIDEVDLIFFGEQHNNAIAHWLQLELTRDLHEERTLVLGAEMFEADNQEAVDLYLNKEIDQDSLNDLARLWPNYKTDYKPLLDFARSNELTFAATNIPRRYAKVVYRGGFEALDTLSDLEKSWIAPLPIDFDPEIKTYTEILNMMGDHGTPELVKAQAIKDATMAHRILKYYKEGSLFIHYNGAYHSDFYEGIIWHLQRKNDRLKILTISTVTQADISELEEEHLGRADFIICVDEDVTKTY